MTTSWFPSARVPALRGGPTLGWGIVAPGQIAHDFAATVQANTDQIIRAVASRSADRARQFAERHQIDLAYEGYERLLADPQVDIVYIAAPHAEHHRLAILAIDAGKHVLVEKPLTVSADQAAEVAAAARAAGVFAAEAMWTRHLPQFDVLEQVVSRGDLGEIPSGQRRFRLANRPIWSPPAARSLAGGRRVARHGRIWLLVRSLRYRRRPRD